MSRLPQQDALHDAIAAGLREYGYIILPQALPPALATGLFKHFRSLKRNEFSRAGVGKRQRLNTRIRGDAVAWIDDSQAAPRDYLDWMEALRIGLNRRLFLGLFDYESHYAWYRRGAFYGRHLDAFRGRSNRVISTVLYLNAGWKPADGGELVLYSGDGSQELERIAPQFSKLVLFLSEEFPHEVLPAQQPRYSLTGWFRVNGSTGRRADPAD